MADEERTPPSVIDPGTGIERKLTPQEQEVWAMMERRKAQEFVERHDEPILDQARSAGDMKTMSVEEAKKRSPRAAQKSWKSWEWK